MKSVIGRLRKSRESVRVDQKEIQRSNKPRIWLWMMGIGALALALVIPLNMAFAVHDEGLFELGTPVDDGNGNLVWLPGSADIQGNDIEPGPDWADLFDENKNLKPGVPEIFGGVTAVFIEDELAAKGGQDVEHKPFPNRVDVFYKDDFLMRYSKCEFLFAESISPENPEVKQYFDLVLKDPKKIIEECGMVFIKEGGLEVIVCDRKKHLSGPTKQEIPDSI